LTKNISKGFSFSTGFLFGKKKKCKESFTKEILTLCTNEKEIRSAGMRIK